MAKRTTTVFDTIDAFVTLLEAQTWPAHPTTTGKPLVVDGDTRDLVDEMVVVFGSRPGGTSEWKTLGAPSQDETYVLAVRVGTKVGGQTQRLTRARLKALTAVIETALRNQTTGVPAGGFVASVTGVQYMTWRVSVVETEVYALPPEVGGFGSYADLEVAFIARI